MPDIPDSNRAQKAHDIRVMASTLSTTGKYADHHSNDDEHAPYIFSFTKGLEHKTNGLVVDPAEFESFATGTETHDPIVFGAVKPSRSVFLPEDGTTPPNGSLSDFRRWESPTAGHTYVLQGADPYALTMPPAPKAGSAEFAAEIAEVYQMALDRDMPIASYMGSDLIGGLTKPDGSAVAKACKDRITKGHHKANVAAGRLSTLRWFAGNHDDGLDAEKKRRRRYGVVQTPSNMYRGIGEDDWETPCLSQFMVMGSGGGSRDIEKRAEGFIQYGAQRIAQTVRVATPERDYMTSWPAFLNVQNGLNKRPMLADGEEFVPGEYRVMSRLRDLATYVHDDQLYQAYLNAALLLTSEGFAFDPGIPYHGNSDTIFPCPGGVDPKDDNREPFALFGGPHLLTMVTEVSSRALKAVRLQKFSVHRRMRPEVAGSLFHTIYSGYHPDREIAGTSAFPQDGNTSEAMARDQLASTLARYTFDTSDGTASTAPALESILTDVRKHNAAQNGEDPDDLNIAKWLLPMAFPEGSPMHPAYGAGHATVAGACVTLLKAFFDMGHPTDPHKKVRLVEKGGFALVPDCGTSAKDCTIDVLCTPMKHGLTLESELNKLMWNISNARNIAGVHYYTDYVESALLGEAITISMLREQMLTYHRNEKVTMTVPLLVKRTLPDAIREGSQIAADEEVSVIRICPDGTLEKVV